MPFSRSQNLIVLSNEPVMRLFFENENLFALIASLWAWKVWRLRIVFKLHNIVLFSVELAAKNSLSIDTATSVIGFENPLKVYCSLPLFAFQILTRASPPPVIMASPKGLKHKHVASLLWAGILNWVFVGNFLLFRM